MNMQRLTLGLTAFLALAGSGFATRGGIERYCTHDGTQITERWLVNTSNQPWRVWEYTGNGNRVVPGFPPMTCVPPGVAQDATPGYQSLIRAARAWNQAAMPFPRVGGGGGVIVPQPLPAKASVFAFSEAPASANIPVNCVPCAFCGVGFDSINSFVFVRCLGGGLSPLVQSITAVTRNDATGEILDADTVFNAARQTPTSPMYFGWLEESSLFQKTLVSEDQPVYGFADIQGVAAHGFGHFAGLAHSMIEATSSASDSRFPTMYLWGGSNSALSGTVYDDENEFETCSNWFSETATISSQPLAGKAARTLEADDIAAIGEGYPHPEFDARLGRISGTVSSGSGGYVRGAIMIAMNELDPNKYRLATFTYAGSSYEFRGLPPGKYYVAVEPLDVGDMGNNAGYFGTWPWNAAFPEYVWGGNNGTAFSCVDAFNIDVGFRPEYFDANEAYLESAGQRGALVTVDAGQVTPNIDFIVSTAPVPTLRANSVLSPHTSWHGAIVDTMAHPSRNVTFVFNSWPANQNVVIWLGTKRKLRTGAAPQAGLYELDETSIVSTITGVTNSSGIFLTTVDLATLLPPATARYYALFAQGGVCPSAGNCPDGTTMLTNCVTAWYAR